MSLDDILSSHRWLAFKEKIKQRRQDDIEKVRDWPPDDRVLLRWTAHGLRCVVLHGPVGLCGYVHVPIGHPDERSDYADVPVDVHGALTFRCRVDDGSWFGFDTAHGGDWLSTPIGEHPGRVWTVEDVRAETERLAEQLVRRGR